MRKGDNLNIGIGQKGEHDGGGAGGTFVETKKSDGTFAPLVVAGGAGGSWNGNKQSYCDAQLEEFGNGPDGQNNMNIGSSGNSGDGSYYNAGAGYQSDPPEATVNHPRCFASGLIGGYRSIYSISLLRWNILSNKIV